MHSDVHHVFPRSILIEQGHGRADYNQIANYVVCQSEINIQIGNREPKTYFAQVKNQVAGGPKAYGNIESEAELFQNLTQNCIPDEIYNWGVDDYSAFLAARQKLMANRIRKYFESL